MQNSTTSYGIQFIDFEPKKDLTATAKNDFEQRAVVMERPMEVFPSDIGDGLVGEKELSPGVPERTAYD